MKNYIKTKTEQTIAFIKEAYTFTIKKTKQFLAVATITILLLLGSVSAWEKANEYLIPFWTDFLVMHTDSFEIKIKQVKAEEEMSVRDYVKQEIEKAGLKWSEAECIIENEGHWKNECNANTNLTTDCGIWRINSVHKNTISFADRLDYKKATAWAINKRLTVGHWNDWVAYKKHCK